MYERMLNKNVMPTVDEINNYIGKKSNELLKEFENELNNRYDIIKTLRFPYGNFYGWSFKFSHKKQHLCDLFFEKDTITIMISIPSKVSEKVSKKVESLLSKTKKLWEERYPCGTGGWRKYQILNREELVDVPSLLEIKKKPIK